MGRMGQESCTGKYVSVCAEYLHCVGCPSNVVTWFLTMSELVEWIDLFCTLGNKRMIMVDETKVASEIRYFWGLRKVLHCLNPFRKWMGASS